MIRAFTLAVAIAAALFLWWPRVPDLAVPPLRLGITTSVEGSGLGAHLAEAWGKPLHRVVAGSGQVFEIARRGDVELILTHEPQGETALFQSGVIEAPRKVMKNRFFIAGPLNDPAHIAHLLAPAAFAAIAGAQHLFISRGDDSGTHKAEQALWAATNTRPAGDWYRATGSGAGASLRMAAQERAYVLIDEASFARFGAQNGLVLLVGGPDNPYRVSVVAASQQRDAAQAFADWLTGPQGQAAIAAFRIDGQQVFTPQTR